MKAGAGEGSAGREARPAEARAGVGSGARWVAEAGNEAALPGAAGLGRGGGRRRPAAAMGNSGGTSGRPSGPARLFHFLPPTTQGWETRPPAGSAPGREGRGWGGPEGAPADGAKRPGLAGRTSAGLGNRAAAPSSSSAVRSAPIGSQGRAGGRAGAGEEGRPWAGEAVRREGGFGV